VDAVAIALGSNLGDRRAHLAWAIEQLSLALTNLRVSPVVETEPVDVPDAQPRYLNAVVVGEFADPPDVLLSTLRRLETERGRQRPGVRAARTLDLDLILYGDRVIRTADLEVPHPRFRTRRFVLEPLATLAPDWRDPVTGRTVAELLAELQ
jgi:2-amino-4-hydroxy-6-hydroxymethyldihydropteridine diphosphokinase